MVVRYRIFWYSELYQGSNSILTYNLTVFFLYLYKKNYFCLSRIPTTVNLLFKKVCKFLIIWFSPDLYRRIQSFTKCNIMGGFLLLPFTSVRAFSFIPNMIMFIMNVHWILLKAFTSVLMFSFFTMSILRLHLKYWIILAFSE